LGNRRFHETERERERELKFNPTHTIINVALAADMLGGLITLLRELHRSSRLMALSADYF